MTITENSEYDVVVIGGGAAGLGGALTLARARRTVLVLDSGRPRNTPAREIHGLLGLDGTPPAEFLTRGRAEVRGYGGEVRSAEVVTAAIEGTGFPVGLANGSSVTARRLLLASGLVDELPDIPGLREHWGRDVVHCPYCHGWEIRDQAIGVLATGPMAAHQALLFRQWSDNIILFSRGLPISEEQREQLAARAIEVIDAEVEALEITDDRITGVRLSDGSVVARQAIAVGSRMIARAAFLSELGLELSQNPMGEHVAVDPMGRTSVPGIWAAGNVADLSAQVGASAAAGVAAAAQINFDLISEETQRAVLELRARAATAARS